MTAPIAADLTRVTSPVRLLPPRRFADPRGWLAEVYSEAAFAAAGIDCRFVQDNHSLSHARWTLRGMHFQLPPYAQAKLVRCVRGRVFDVAVDLRAASPSHGRWIGTELSAADGAQLFIPAGFAHGFLTLESECEIAYKVSARYAPASECVLRWDDPAIGVAWPLPPGVVPRMSDRDAHGTAFADPVPAFQYDGLPLGDGVP